MSKVIVIAIVLASAAARAQVPEVTHSCVATCDSAGRCTDGCGGTSESDSSSDSAAAIAHMHAEEQAQHDRVLANQLAANEAERRHNARAKSDAGMAAAHRHDWALAAQEFEDANRLDPEPQYAQALADVRAEEAKARRAALAAVGPSVPGWGAPVRVGTRLGGLVPSIDANVYLGYSLSYLRTHADEAIDGTCDVTIAQSVFICVEHNITKLATVAIPDWLTRAANGTMTLEEARTLPLVATAMIFNVGTAPGSYAEQLVELRDARIVATKKIEGWLTSKAEAGVTSLAAGLGASVKYGADSPYLWDQIQHAEMKKELEPLAKHALTATSAIYDRWFTTK